MARFEVATAEEARRMLDYFNAFHDGFIKKMTLVSHDEMEQDYSQTCTGRFDVECDIAHYNYGYVTGETSSGETPQRDATSALRPCDQIVRARFLDVQDVEIDLGEGYLGNTILAPSVSEESRRRANTTSRERALALYLARHFHLEHLRRHELRKSRIFTFRRALVFEMPPGGGSDRSPPSRVGR